MKCISAVIICMSIIIMFSVYSMATDKNENQDDYFKEQVLAADKRIKNCIEKMEVPYYYNEETRKVEKKMKFSISLKRLQNIVLEHGDQIRISLECRMEFGNDDKIRRIEFLETKIKVKNNLEEIRNIVNENPLSGGMGDVYIEFKDYNQKADKTKPLPGRFSFSEITDGYTGLEIRNMYFNWLEDVRYKLFMINRGVEKKRKLTGMQALDI